MEHLQALGSCLPLPPLTHHARPYPCSRVVTSKQSLGFTRGCHGTSLESDGKGFESLPYTYPLCGLGQVT